MRGHVLPSVLIASVLLGCVPAAPALASSSRAWVLRNRDDFKDARLDGAALTSDGAIRLSATATPLLDPAQPNLWCLARDPRGRLYAGSGNDGKVFRIDADGKSEVVFDSEELEVHAIAFDAAGRLFVATSPRGAVYMIGEGGVPVVVYRPEETYLWDIAFDGRGRLYAATGQKGRVYRIDEPGPNAKAITVLDGREDHVRTLAVSPSGAVYAGTDQSGILYRIMPDGTSSVVFDSPMQEISAIAVAAGDGGRDTAYIAALAPMPLQRGGGPRQQQSGGVTRVRVTADEPGGDQDQTPDEDDEQPEDQGQKRQPAQARPPTAAYFGAVYRVAEDGYARKIWESREALPLSLALFGGGPRASRRGADRPGVLVGTGNDGRVILLDEEGDAAEYVTAPSQQVNDLLAEDTGGFVAAASNLGQVLRIRPEAAATGSVTSSVLDAGFTSAWGTIAWDVDAPARGVVTIQVRTGNTATPDDSWSDWSARYTDPRGTTIDRPRARFLQWRATLESGREEPGPVLRNIRISYLQDNMPPEIASVEVLSPGIVLTGSGERSGDAGEGSQAARRAQNQPRRSFEKGRMSVGWKSEDANDDGLRFDVFFKAEDETLWKPLARDLEDEFLSWDATAMPDGVYRIRVVATDAPSNPQGAALAGWKVSSAFDVDNTPPVVGSIHAEVTASRAGAGAGSGRAADLEVTVTDSFSVVADVAYSVDAADWVPLLPVDRIADSMKETYRFRVEVMDPGEHTVTVRARDRAGNTSANKVVVRVER